MKGPVADNFNVWMWKNKLEIKNENFINFFFHISADSSLTIVRRLSGKKQQQGFQSELAESNLEQYNLISNSEKNVTSDYCLENRIKMQPTSNIDNLENIDLTTENLPAVDTPDACDKAALRFVTIAQVLLIFISARHRILSFSFFV